MKTPYPVKHICCIGAGYVGGPIGAIIASQHPNIIVTVVDINEAHIAAWNSAILPIYEPHLHELVVKVRDGDNVTEPNLFFSTDVDKAIREADMIFLGVNTPTKEYGVGAGRAADLTWLERAVKRIAANAVGHTIVVEKSTVPCGTAKRINAILKDNGRGATFDIICNPETFAEGTAVKDFVNPDRVLIGRFESSSAERAAMALANIYNAWVPTERVVIMDINSCELAKVASNALLAQKISSVNTLSAMCEKLGADVEQVAHACGLDQRIGPSMLNASVGFGGSCFRKDIMNLAYMAETLNLPEAASYWSSIVDINEWQQKRIVGRVIQALSGTLAGKKIAVFGLSYKKNTSDTRDSPAIQVVRNLLAEKAVISIFDPRVSAHQIRVDFEAPKGLHDSLLVSNTPYEAADDAQAVLLLTEWDMFRSKPLLVNQMTQNGYACEKFNSELQKVETCRNGSALDDDAGDVSVDWTRISTLMALPKYIFDGRNLIRPEHLLPLGFKVDIIGKSAGTTVQHFHHVVPKYH